MGVEEDLKIFAGEGIIMPKQLAVKAGKRPKLFSTDRYVVKAYGKKIVHKTEMRAVKTDVEKELVEVEMRRMRNRLGNRVEGFLIQEQVPRGVEIIVGAKRDGQFGDVVLFGLGGVYVELYKDVSVRLCPVSTADAVEMIDETKAAKIFEGFRGAKTISKHMAAGVIKKVCSIMHKNKDIREIDLNPVILYPNSYYAVDVRVVR